MLAKLVVILAVSSVCLTARLPSYYQTCHINDAEFKTCLATSIEDALRKLKDGERSLGLQPIGPLQVGNITLDLGTGPISLLFTVHNVTMIGLETTTIKSAGLDLKNHQLVVNAYTNQLRIDFLYKAAGSILVVPVLGEGPASCQFDGAHHEHIISSEPLQAKGRTYWKIKDYKIDIEPTLMRCQFHELVKGNLQISQQLNDFLNREWKLFYKQVKKPAQDISVIIFKNMAERVFNRVPISEIFHDK